jgi:hypothetical protein
MPHVLKFESCDSLAVAQSSGVLSSIVFIIAYLILPAQQIWKQLEDKDK